MSAAWIVVDLGLGDAGKGATVDFLCRDRGADLVVRWHGGAQAGHNVVTPGGRHHTFSQWGSGTLAGVPTALGPGFVLHPLALRFEAAHLAAIGVPDPLGALTVDPEALCISPFQQAAGRLRELARGAAAHGTCGVGFGEAVGDTLAHGDAIRAHHLRADDLVARLAAHQARKRAECAGLPTEDPRAAPERALLDDASAPARIAAAWRALAADLRLAPAADALRRARRPVLEGAQGVLLDQTWGLHPHTTWSDCTAAGARALLGAREATTLGVLRTYATRHGAGPLPTHDPAWDAALPEPHNDAAGWQGAFRRGPLDLALLRYAARACPVDALALTHLDAPLPARVVAEGYDPPVALEPGPADDVGRRATITRALAAAIPRLRPVDDLDEAVGDAIGAPVALRAWGPTAATRAWSARMPA